MPFAPEPEVKVHRDPGWDKVEKPVQQGPGGGGGLSGLGQRPLTLGSLSPASCPSWTRLASRPGPLGPPRLAASPRLQSGWQAHGRPLPRFHSGLCASVPPGRLGTPAPTSLPRQNGNVRLPQGGRSNQVPRCLARPGPSTQLPGAGERVRGLGPQHAGRQGHLLLAGHLQLRPSVPHAGSYGGMAGLCSSSLAQEELFVIVIDHVSTGRGLQSTVPRTRGSAGALRIARSPLMGTAPCR